MLGKLIKHEWKSFWKIPGFINLFLIIYTLCGILALHSKIFDSNNIFIEAVTAMATLFYWLSVIVISFTVIIFIAVRFYKNMYTDEGYLMHTLPVTQKSLIISKLLVSYAWLFITISVITVCILSLLGTLLSVTTEGFTLSRLFSIVFDFLFSHNGIFKDFAGISVPHVIVLLVLFLLAACAYGILMLYAAVSLGQLIQRHKILGSIVSFIGIYMVIQFSNTLGIALLSLTEIKLGAFLYVVLFWVIALCALFFFLTEWIMKRKLNLD